MNMIPAQAVEDVVDIATVDQQIELHAQKVERIQRDAIYEIGREFAAIQNLHRYRRDGEGFTDFLSRRFPTFPQSSAYQCIKIFQGIGQEMFPIFGNFRPASLEEIAKSDPDIQSLIAERVAAGEVFTAAQVKEIKEAAERESEAYRAKLDEAEKTALASVELVKDDAEKRIKELESSVAATDITDDPQPAFDLSSAVEDATKSKDEEIAVLKAKLEAVENDPAMKAMRDAVADAAKNAGKKTKTRKNPHHNPDAAVHATLSVTGPCRQILTNAARMKPSEVWDGFHDEEHKSEGKDLIASVRDLLTKFLENDNVE